MVTKIQKKAATAGADKSIEALKEEARRIQLEIDKSIVNFPLTKTDRNGNLKPIGHQENTEALLAHYGITCRHNEMTKEMEINVIGKEFHKETQRNAVIEYVADCARAQGYSPEVAVSNLTLIAGENVYHPARDWVLSKEWDGQDRLHHVYDALKQADDTPVEDVKFKELLIKRWLIANVALLMHNTQYESDEHKERGFLGTEGVLVLQGSQGLNKTSFFESLVPPRSGFFGGGISLDPNNKDSVALAIKHWIIELGELDSVFRKADVSALRAWFTKKVDEYRPPYERTINSYHRRTGVGASVNDMDFLPEKDENRRYWNIAVVSVKVLKDIDIQQLWAQAYHLYRSNEIFWLRVEERAQLYKLNKQFERAVPLLDMIEECVELPSPAKTAKGLGLDDKLDTKGKGKIASAQYGQVPELLGASQIIQRVTGQMTSSTKDCGDVGKWLVSKGFTKHSASKKYYVIIKATWDPISRKTKKLFE